MKVQTHYYAVDGMISILSSVLYLVFAGVLLVPLLESTSMSESHDIISSYISDGSMALFCRLHKLSTRSIKDFLLLLFNILRNLALCCFNVEDPFEFNI